MVDKYEWSLNVLGLRRGATKAEIKEAYRDLVVVWHPDKFATNERLRLKAESMLLQINEANLYLSRSGFEREMDESEPNDTAPGAKESETDWVQELWEYERVARRRQRTKAIYLWSLACTMCLGLLGYFVYRQVPLENLRSSMGAQTLATPSSPSPLYGDSTSSADESDLSVERRDSSSELANGELEEPTSSRADSSGLTSAMTPDSVPRKPRRFGSTTEVARILATPDEQSEVLYRVAPGTLLGITGSSGDHYRVAVKTGQSAYVRKDQVKLNAKPIPSVTESPKSWRGRILTSPSGNVFRWDKDTPPTRQDFKTLIARDKEMAPIVLPMVDAFRKANGRNPTDEERLQIQARATEKSLAREAPSSPANLGVEVKGVPDNPSQKEFYTMGSSEQEVRVVQGPPSSVIGNTWRYDFSSVRFQNGRVAGYTNVNNNLKVLLSPSSKFKPSFFTLGSPSDVVLLVQGTPSAVTGSTWNYDSSSVRFSDGHVAAYSNTKKNLRVKVFPKSKTRKAEFIGPGSSMDQVLQIQGTPTAIIGNLWSYDLSSVRFSEGVIAEYSNISGNLRVK